MSVYIQIPKQKYSEGTAFTATAYFRSGTAASTPSAAKYRIDCLTTCKEIKDWTTLTPAASISISVTATENTIEDESNQIEKKQITVASEPDTASQEREVRTWKVINNEALPTS